MQRLRRLLPVLALLCPAACSTPPVVHDGAEVVILQGHQHSRYCGHYEHEGSWYYVRDHKHGVKCGHSMEAGVWVKRRK